MFDLKWKSAYKVGHARIDFEHKIFLGLIQKLDREIEEGANLEKLMRTLFEIRKYAEFHFVSEENVMIDIGYPDLENHRRLHGLLIDHLKRFAEHAGGGEIPAEDILIFLRDWYLHHTTTEDTRISSHVKAGEIDD